MKKLSFLYRIRTEQFLILLQREAVPAQAGITSRFIFPYHQPAYTPSKNYKVERTFISSDGQAVYEKRLPKRVAVRV